MRHYYNDFDPFAAAWLRNLVAAGHLPAGDVDERSITDVQPEDVCGYVQCHFFAGIGGWPLALALAGWPADRPVWTGSCPCQPFSAAGQQRGTDDERHLWPAWFRLIRARRPATLFGEQVEAAVRHGWLDVVCADLAGEGYAFGAAVLGAHSVGAPHIRQRLWFVADAGRGCDEHWKRSGEALRAAGANESQAWERQRCRAHLGRGGAARSVADLPKQGRNEQPLGDGRAHGRPSPEPRRLCDARDLGDADFAGLEGRGLPVGQCAGERPPGPAGGDADAWSGADWLPCTDGKARPVEPGTFPLAHGIPGRVGRLRAYGNAIVPQVAAEFVRAFMECRP